MLQAIIFDCFGVIYPDTLALVERRFLKPAESSKKQRIKELRRQSDAGLVSRDKFWTGIAQILDVSTSELNAELDTVRGADWELLDYVKSLKQQHKTALLSNVGRGFLERIFDEQRPADHYFDAIIASGDIGAMKPEPEAYQAVCDRLGVEPSACVFIDDKQVHCQGAQALGMEAILYQDLEQLKRELGQILADS